MNGIRNTLWHVLQPCLAAIAVLSSLLVVMTSHSVTRAEAAPPAEWAVWFGYPSSADPVSCDSEGVYVAVGLEDSYLRKYSVDGDQLWSRPLAEEGAFSPSAAALCAWSDSVYVTGPGLYGPPGGGGDGGAAFVHRYDSDGHLVWGRSLGIYLRNSPCAISADSTGVYAAGYTCEHPAYEPYAEGSFVAKYDANGNPMWTRVDDSYEATSISAYGGSVYVAGNASDEGFLRKYDSNGNEVWYRLPGFADQVAVHGVSADSSGVYIAGEAHAISGGGSFVRKYDSNGNQVWTRQFSDMWWASGVSVYSGSVYVVGTTQAPDYPVETPCVRKYDADGNLEWMGLYEVGGGYSVSACSSGVYATGMREGEGYVFKLPPPVNQPPAQPSNVSPLNAATGMSLTPTLQSSAFSDPGDTHSASQWQIRTSTGDYSSPAYDSGTTGTHLVSLSVPAGELDCSMTYHWRVRHQDNRAAWSSWSTETSFTTVSAPNQPPGQPSNISPSNGAAGVYLLATLQSSVFSDPDAADTHAASQWQVRTISVDYSSPTYDSGTTPTDLTTIAIPPGQLDYSTTYYWRVRHQDVGSAWSDWSDETWFSTVAQPNQPPSQPNNLSPANGANTVDVLPILQSSAFSDPDAGDTHGASQWQVTATAGDYSSPAFDSSADASNLTSITLPSGTLGYVTTYYWRVMHQDNQGTWSAWSTETSFTTAATPNQQPAQPTNVAPADGAVDVSLSPTLDSSAFSDPDAGDTHAASQWQITAAAGDYSSPVFDSGIDSTNLASITVQSGMFSYSTSYYWRVRHQDDHSTWSPYSDETTFTTLALVSQPPDQPTASTPSAGATDVSLTPTLSSSAFSDPDSGDTHGASQWQVRTTGGIYIDPVYDSGSSASHLTSIVIPSGMLDYATTYCWHVRYMDNNGAWSDWSEEARFTTLAEDGDGGNGEVGGCCNSSNVDASAGDIAIAWGTLGFCCGTGLLFARRLGERNKK